MIAVVLEVLGYVLDIVTSTANAATAIAYITSVVDALTGNTAAIKTTVENIDGNTSGIGDTLTTALGPIGTNVNHVETKVSNVQWMLTSVIGFPDVVGHYPTLDLRPLVNATPGYAPESGGLYQWMLHLTKLMVPNVATNHRYLGRITENSTLALPDCWGVEVALVSVPLGYAFSSQVDAPIGEWLARVSLGRGEYYDQERYIHHPKTYIPLNGFIPTAVAVEIRPGATLDLWAVMPVGYI